MGDRRIAEIKDGDGSLFFYTHSYGHSLPAIARQALEVAEPRKTDTSYAFRRVVDYLIMATGSRDKEVGSGLSFLPNSEDEYGDPPTVIIDLKKWSVTALETEWSTR
jgi:hypothetical protein